MSKTKEELLLDYKKSNKVRRNSIIKKAGFTNEADYLTHLMSADTVVTGGAGFFKHNKDTTVPETDMLDQVIAFDTTGSMNGYIAAVKTHVQTLIPQLFAANPNLRIKVVAFGDYCDMKAANNFGNAYQESALTNDEAALIDFVKHAKGTGGGDGDEFYELVIKKITEETPWRAGSKRAVLLIADCGPHPVGYTYNAIVRNAQIDWKVEAKKSNDIGVQWDTMNCGAGWQNTFYKPLSEMTNGVNIPFSSQEKTHEAVYATTSVRGSMKSKKDFEVAYTAALASGDEELIGTYKSLSKKL